MDPSIGGISLFPVFLVGLAGSVHCAGMCGGIVSALSVSTRRAAMPAFPVPVRTATASGTASGTLCVPGLARVMAYNAGRIASYAAAGALAGLPALQAGAYVAANLMLVALGLYLMGAWRGLARLEGAGQALWRRLAPQLARLQPFDTPGRMFGAGALWGWLPCGMVYSVLATAMLSGSAPGGAAVMLAFGLGTLPMLAALGLAGMRLRARLAQREVRLACGLLVLGFGLLGLLRAGGGLPGHWLGALCLTGGTPA